MPVPELRPPDDLRKHHPRTERNLIIGGFVLMFVVGGGLVWRFYGTSAFITSVLCLSSGVAVMGLIYLILKLMEVAVRPRDGEP